MGRLGNVLHGYGAVADFLRQVIGCGHRFFGVLMYSAAAFACFAHMSMTPLVPRMVLPFMRLSASSRLLMASALSLLAS